MAIKITTQDYLIKSENKFRTFKREWESFTREAPEKLFNLVKGGIHPDISVNSSGYGQFGCSLTLKSNTDAAEEYIKEVKVKIEKKSDEIEANIKDIDKNLQMYLDEGIDGNLFAKMVKHMNELIAYIPQMSFKMSNGCTINFNASKDVIAIKKKWENVSAEEVRKKEAEKYGVALEDLDKHKVYLDAKSQKNTAKTSTAMKKAKKAFTAINGYLDSADLAKACTAIAAELKVKEDKKARIKKEREDARKREEAERLRKAIEAYEKELAEVTKAREAYITSETDNIERKHKNAMDALKSDYDAACEKNKSKIENASTEKIHLEQELEEASLFAFGKKKQLRADIETLTEGLRRLATEKENIDANYEEARTKQKNRRESVLRVLPMNAGKKYPMPKDPRK